MKKPTVKKAIRHNQQGVGMIEVLITLFILSIGLLGVASLQFVSSFSNSDALNRTQSIIVAQQLAERMRASASMSLVGDGMVVDDTYFDDSIYNFANLSCDGNGQAYPCYCLTLPADIPNCNENTCTAAQIATFDGYEASCSAVVTNPSVNVEVNCRDIDAVDGEACSAGSRISILLSWPVENWQNIDRDLNADCNVNKTEPHDCVVVDLVL